MGIVSRGFPSPRGQHGLTGVTVAFRGLVLLPLITANLLASDKLSFPTWLLVSQSLNPRGPPFWLLKNSSSVSGTQMGASCAKAKLGLTAIARMDGSEPMTLRKPGWYTWKNGGEMLVGLKWSIHPSPLNEELGE